MLVVTLISTFLQLKSHFNYKVPKLIPQVIQEKQPQPR